MELRYNDIEAVETESLSNLNPEHLDLFFALNKIYGVASGFFAELTGALLLGFYC